MPEYQESRLDVCKKLAHLRLTVHTRQNTPHTTYGVLTLT